MKEAMTKVIDTPTQEDFHGASHKLLERYKCIAAGGDYLERGLEFHVCTINKSAHTKKSGDLSYAPRIYYISIIENKNFGEVIFKTSGMF